MNRPFRVLDLCRSRFPIVEVRGAADGPTLCLLAGVDGCAYSSIQAVRSFVRNLRSERVSGRVHALAFVNPASPLQHSPFVSPQDGRNPNRSFQGDRGAERPPHRSTWGTWWRRSIHSYLFDESEVGATARRMAIAFGFENLIQVPHAKWIDGSTSAAAGDVGIAAILAEAGARPSATGSAA
jgi:predicted deacylase